MAHTALHAPRIRQLAAQPSAGMTTGSEELAALRKEVSALRAELLFRGVRDRFAYTNYGTTLISNGASIPRHVKLAYATNGKGLYQGFAVSRASHERRHSVDLGQVSSVAIKEMLTFNGSRPVWNRQLLQEYRAMAARGESLSPLSYPHAAEDLRRACEFAISARPELAVAVWSSSAQTAAFEP